MPKLKPLFHTVTANKLGLWLGRRLPRNAGYALADSVAWVITRRKSSRTVQSMLANQRHVQPDLPLKELAAIPYTTMRLFSRSLYDYYHFYDTPEQVESLVEITPNIASMLAQRKTGDRGLVLVMPHTPGFDLAGLRLIRLGLEVFVLSVPDPAGAYRWQNYLREGYGMHIAPFSPQAIQTARQYLQDGKAVLTGVDRPNPEGAYAPRFFGQPARLPVAHIRLALRTNTPISVIAVFAKPDGGYVVDCTEPIEMLPHPDLHTEVTANAERVLEEMAAVILRAPEQWSMFFPVWDT